MILPALHIPDGFLPLPLSLAGWLLAGLLLGWALKTSRHHHEDALVPLMGLLAAFLFTAQTIHFPVPGGTTAHLLGAVLCTLLLGPAAAILVITAVLLVQALIFGDGGLLVMGWNIINIAGFSGCAGYAMHRLLRRFGVGQTAAAFVAAWCATELGAVATCLELALAETSPLQVSLPVMLISQGVVGLGEAAVTAAAVAYVARAQPQLLAPENAHEQPH